MALIKTVNAIFFLTTNIKLPTQRFSIQENSEGKYINNVNFWL